MSIYFFLNIVNYLNTSMENVCKYIDWDLGKKIENNKKWL